MVARFDLETWGATGGDGGRARPRRPSLVRASVRALGGAANLRSVDACTTRLRLSVAGQAAVDEHALSGSAPAAWCDRPSTRCRSWSAGADRLAEEIRATLCGARER